MALSKVMSKVLTPGDWIVSHHGEQSRDEHDDLRKAPPGSLGLIDYVHVVGGEQKILYSVFFQEHDVLVYIDSTDLSEEGAYSFVCSAPWKPVQIKPQDGARIVAAGAEGENASSGTYHAEDDRLVHDFSEEMTGQLEEWAAWIAAPKTGG